MDHKPLRGGVRTWLLLCRPAILLALEKRTPASLSSSFFLPNVDVFHIFATFRCLTFPALLGEIVWDLILCVSNSKIGKLIPLSCLDMLLSFCLQIGEYGTDEGSLIYFIWKTKGHEIVISNKCSVWCYCKIAGMHSSALVGNCI